MRVLFYVLINVKTLPFVYFSRNLPLGLSPGIGLSAYLTYGLVLGDRLSIQEAFTSVSFVLLLSYFLFGLTRAFSYTLSALLRE